MSAAPELRERGTFGFEASPVNKGDVDTFPGR